MSIALQTNAIIKDFPGVRALNNVSFTLEEGTIHALVGENGAGKSTLINILSGVYPFGTYEGAFSVMGKEARFLTVADSAAQGIAVIHQELSMFPELSVTENIFVHNEITSGAFLDHYAMRRDTLALLKKLKMESVSPDAKVGTLGVGKQQLIEIARALKLNDVKILILDEPTASLTEVETDILLGILRELRQTGMSIIYISHKLDEVLAIADDITVLRDGQSVGSAKANEMTKDALVTMMVGREIHEMYPHRDVNIGDVLFEVSNANVKEHNTGKTVVENAGFSLRKSEILGFYGLIGSGRTELMLSVFGSNLYEHSEEVRFEGKKLDISGPADAIANGIFYCSEDRKVLGIIPTMDISENVTIPRLELFKNGLLIDKDKEKLEVMEKVRDFRIKTASLLTKIVNLSGGNQQKVLLARSILGNTKVLILDEPTRGIDVGAKQEIYSLMNELSENGVSVIMVSSELPEVLGVCDRVVVMHEGIITGEFDNTQHTLTQEEVIVKATETR